MSEEVQNQENKIVDVAEEVNNVDSPTVNTTDAAETIEATESVENLECVENSNCMQNSEDAAILEANSSESEDCEDTEACVEGDADSECCAESVESADSMELAAEAEAIDESVNEALGIVPVLQALFLSSSDPLDLATLAQICEVEQECVSEAIKILTAQLESDAYGISLVPVAKGFQFRTKAQYGRYIRALRQEAPKKLSPAALETLAVIAYRQPVVKHDIDGLRGVDVMPTLKTLLDRGLIQVVGHRDTVGHPSLYGTTDEFLRIFGLNSVQDLPTVNELNNLKSEPGEEASGFENPLASMVQGDPEHVTASSTAS